MRALVVVALLCVACGRIGFSGLGDDTSGDDAPSDGSSDGAPAFHACQSWNDEVPVDDLNEVMERDFEVVIHPNGSTVVFSSARDADIVKLYTAERTGPTSFTNIQQIESAGFNDDYTGGPAWNASGDTLYFSLHSATARCYAAPYNATTGEFDMPVDLGLDDCLAVTISGDELELYYNGFTTKKLFWATRPSKSAAWESHGQLAIANSLLAGSSDGWPSLSADGLTLYWERLSGGIGEIQFMRRSDPDDVWTSEPQPVAEFNDADVQGDPKIDPTGRLFAFAREVGLDDHDIYFATCAD